MIELPKKGERIIIRWPGGPHDFVMIYEGEPPTCTPPLEGYAWLRGEIVEPSSGPWTEHRTLHARPTGRPGEYSLVGNNVPDWRTIG